MMSPPRPIPPIPPHWKQSPYIGYAVGVQIGGGADRQRQIAVTRVNVDGAALASPLLVVELMEAPIPTALASSSPATVKVPPLSAWR